MIVKVRTIKAITSEGPTRSRSADNTQHESQAREIYLTREHSGLGWGLYSVLIRHSARHRSRTSHTGNGLYSYKYTVYGWRRAYVNLDLL